MTTCTTKSAMSRVGAFRGTHLRRMLMPPGIYDVRLYSPVTGEYSPAIEVTGGGKSSLALPPFKEDIVLRATRREP
jgi:hypothetical protein